jgi:hypothetical protein
MLITIGVYTPVYSFSLFLPTIVRNMGYSAERSQLMSVPPYVSGCIITIMSGYYADKLRMRGNFMMGFCGLAIVGWAMLISSGRPAIQYTGTFFACAGIFPLVPMGVAWNGNNIGGSLKRGVGIAMHVGFGNLGGVLASFIYLTRDSPRYAHICVTQLTMSFQKTITDRFLDSSPVMRFSLD